MIDHPLSGRDAWVLLFSNSSLPILRSTKRRLIEMRKDTDKVDARELTRLILRDPIMTVRVLAYIQPFHGRSLPRHITTIAGAVMMSGLMPFFRRFESLPTIEDSLAKYDQHALLGVLHIIRRAQRAAEYAHDWAIWRQDMNMEEISIAALLSDLAETLVWCFAPKLGLEILAQQQVDPNMRSSDAQIHTLGLDFQDIQQALCKVWNLPRLLAQLIDDQPSDVMRVRNVTLAVRLARHSAHGWDDPALPDDYEEIGTLLNLNPAIVRQRLIRSNAPGETAKGHDDQPQ